MKMIVTTEIDIDDTAVAAYYEVAKHQDALPNIEAAIAREVQHNLSGNGFITYHLEGTIVRSTAKAVAR